MAARELSKRSVVRRWKEQKPDKGKRLGSRRVKPFEKPMLDGREAWCRGTDRKSPNRKREGGRRKEKRNKSHYHLSYVKNPM